MDSLFTFTECITCWLDLPCMNMDVHASQHSQNALPVGPTFTHGWICSVLTWMCMRATPPRPIDQCLHVPFFELPCWHCTYRPLSSHADSMQLCSSVPPQLYKCDRRCLPVCDGVRQTVDLILRNCGLLLQSLSEWLDPCWNHISTYLYIIYIQSLTSNSYIITVVYRCDVLCYEWITNPPGDNVRADLADEFLVMISTRTNI